LRDGGTQDKWMIHIKPLFKYFAQFVAKGWTWLHDWQAHDK